MVSHGMTLGISLRCMVSEVDPMGVELDVHNTTILYWHDLQVILPRDGVGMRCP